MNQLSTDEILRRGRLMRKTRQCVPPGHCWPPVPVGTRKPGDPCQCGQEPYEDWYWECPDRDIRLGEL